MSKREWSQSAEVTSSSSTRYEIYINNTHYYRGVIRVSNGRPTSGAVQVDNGVDGPKYVNIVSWKFGRKDTIETAKAYLLKQMGLYAK